MSFFNDDRSRFDIFLSFPRIRFGKLASAALVGAALAMCAALVPAHAQVIIPFSSDDAAQTETPPPGNVPAVVPPLQVAQNQVISESTPPVEAQVEKPAKPQGKRQAKASTRSPQSTGATGYFIEFRARSALSYGHTFVTYGRTNSRGQIVSSTVAGLHPAGDSPVPWMIGHLIPVQSETGASDGDTEDEYIAARYRVNLTAEQYADVTGFIKRLQDSSPVWHAVWYNCNAFVGDIARHMGFQAPGSLEYPANYINGIKSLNGGRSRMADRVALSAPSFEPAR
jgi:hypothetical protein